MDSDNANMAKYLIANNLVVPFHIIPISNDEIQNQRDCMERNSAGKDETISFCILADI